MTTRADGVDRQAHPLFQAGGSGSIPTSALSLWVHEIDMATAARLNRAWHSALPVVELPTCKGKAVAYAASFDGTVFAVAIWSDPVAPSQDDRRTIELRRMAVSADAPKNTASRMLAIMSRLLAIRFGGVRLISYQAEAIHSGTIYRAAGWTRASVSKHAEWGTRKRRKRAAGFRIAPSTRRASQIVSDKVRWEKHLPPRGSQALDGNAAPRQSGPRGGGLEETHPSLFGLEVA